MFSKNNKIPSRNQNHVKTPCDEIKLFIVKQNNQKECLTLNFPICDLSKRKQEAADYDIYHINV